MFVPLTVAVTLDHYGQVTINTEIFMPVISKELRIEGLFGTPFDVYVSDIKHNVQTGQFKVMASTYYGCYYPVDAKLAEQIKAIGAKQALVNHLNDKTVHRWTV